MVSNKKNYKIIFRVRAKYYAQIVSGKKQTEYRQTSPYWQRVLRQINNYLKRVVYHPSDKLVRTVNFFDVSSTNRWRIDVTGVDIQAIFICAAGQKHIRKVIAIEHLETPDEIKEQAGNDVTTKMCYKFTLGAQIEAPTKTSAGA